MATIYRSSIYPAQFVGSSTLTLQQVHNVSVNPGSSKDVITPGGALDPAAIPTVFADPRITCATHDIVTVQGAVSVTAGLAVTSSSMVQYQARSDGATFEGSGSHITATITKGWLGISSMSASQDGPAEVGLTCYPLYDGSNLPIVYNASQSLTSTPAFTSKFYLGPVYVNGSEVRGVQSVTFSPGIEYRPVRESGDVYARKGSIIARNPTISITTTDVSVVGTVGNFFNASLAGTIAVYFRKGVSGGSRVADATTSHCKLSGASGVWGPDTVSVAQNSDATVTLTAQLTTTAAFSVTSAIP